MDKHIAKSAEIITIILTDGQVALAKGELRGVSVFSKEKKAQNFNLN